MANENFTLAKEAEKLALSITTMTQQSLDEVKSYIKDPEYIKKIEGIAALRKSTSDDVLASLADFRAAKEKEDEKNIDHDAKLSTNPDR